MTAREVMRNVQNGYRLERPSHCRSELFRVISRCWHADPDRRPEFQTLRRDLAQLLEDNMNGHYVDLESFASECTDWTDSFRFEARIPWKLFIFHFDDRSRASRVDLHRYRLMDIETTRWIPLKSYSFVRYRHLIDNCTSGVMFLFMCSLLLEENCKLVSFTRDFFYTLWQGKAVDCENLYIE